MDFNEGLLSRLELFAKLSVPYALMLALFLIGFVSLPQPFSLLVNAPLWLMALYYWSLFRPTLLPHMIVFLSGLCVDLLSGYPVGLHALLFLMIRLFVSSQRRFLIGQTFMMIWLGFGIVLTAYVVCEWVFLSLISLKILPISGAVYESVFGLLMFPVVLLLLHFTHKILPVPQADLARTMEENRTGQGF